VVKKITDAYPDKNGKGHGHSDGAEVSQQPHDFFTIAGRFAHVFPSSPAVCKNRLDSYHGVTLMSTGFLLFRQLFE
jgi:hypothetical protein